MSDWAAYVASFEWCVTRTSAYAVWELGELWRERRTAEGVALPCNQGAMTPDARNVADRRW